MILASVNKTTDVRIFIPERTFFKAYELTHRDKRILSRSTYKYPNSMGREIKCSIILKYRVMMVYFRGFDKWHFVRKTIVEKLRGICTLSHKIRVMLVNMPEAYRLRSVHKIWSKPKKEGNIKLKWTAHMKIRTTSTKMQTPPPK
jgi:hypothetical protein